MNKKNRYVLAIYAFLILLVNVVCYFYDYRIEPMEAGYKLDEASVKILDSVDEDVIVTIYESDNLLPYEQRFADKVKLILTSYQSKARKPIHVEFINPLESLEVELDAINAGIRAMELEGEDKMLRKIYLGMIIQKGEKIEVLPSLKPWMSIEYLISSSLRKLNEDRPRRIALIQGHGEASLSNIADVAKRLRPNYRIEPIALNSSSEPWKDYESLLIIGPSFQYKETELKKLDAFLDAGKNIFLALDRVEYDIKEQEGYPIDTKLEFWLAEKGLVMYSDFIVDNSCGDVRLSEYAPKIAYPYFPQITSFPSHVTTNGVRMIALRYASSIEFVGGDEIQFTPLAQTSEVSGKKTLPLHIDFNYEWTKSDFLYPEQVVSGVLEGKLGAKNAKIAVISDGDLAYGNAEAQDYENHLFVSNVIDWLSDSSGLVALKHKGIMQESPDLAEEVSTLRKYVNLFLPLFILACIGLFVFWRKHKHIEKLLAANF